MKRFLLLGVAIALSQGSAFAQDRSVQLSQDNRGPIQYTTSTQVTTFPGAITSPSGTVTLTGNVTVSGTENVVGTLSVNGDSNLICPSLVIYGAPAAATSTVFFIANRPLLLVSAKEIHAVAAGGASTATLTKDTGTDAPGAGTSLHQSGSFDLNATANTIQSATITTTGATKTFAAGDRLAFKFANAIQSSSGITVTACFAPQ